MPPGPCAFGHYTSLLRTEFVERCLQTSNILVRLTGAPGTAMPESDGIPAPRLAAQHNEVAMAKKTAKKKTKTKAKGKGKKKK